jgi:hypothetical protein
MMYMMQNTIFSTTHDWSQLSIRQVNSAHRDVLAVHAQGFVVHHRHGAGEGAQRRVVLQQVRCLRAQGASKERGKALHAALDVRFCRTGKPL